MPALQVTELTHATAPVFPEGLILIEHPSSGEVRVWSAETFQKAVNKAAAWATLQKKYDLADAISRSDALPELRKVLAKDLLRLDVYEWGEFKSIELEDVSAKVIAQGHILGWLRRKQEIAVEYD